MWTLALAALADPVRIPTTTADAGAAFEWPEGAAPCRATLVLSAAGTVDRVVGTCADALRSVLDGLVGAKLGSGAGIAEVRLLPPIEGTTTVPHVRPFPVRPRSWPTKWPGAFETLPAGSACAVDLAWEADGTPSALTVTGCPEAMAKAIEKAGLRTTWTAPQVDAPDGFAATLAISWIEDPSNALKRLLVIEGGATVRTQVPPAFPQGMTGGAACVAAVHLEPNGAPSVVRIFGCTPPWNSAARSALQKWSFYPRLVDGELLPDDDVIEVTFELR